MGGIAEYQYWFVSVTLHLISMTENAFIPFARSESELRKAFRVFSVPIMFAQLIQNALLYRRAITEKYKITFLTWKRYDTSITLHCTGWGTMDSSWRLSRYGTKIIIVSLEIVARLHRREWEPWESLLRVHYIKRSLNISNKVIEEEMVTPQPENIFEKHLEENNYIHFFGRKQIFINKYRLRK